MKTLAGFTLLLALVLATSPVSGLAAAVSETEVTHVDVTPGAAGFIFNVSAVVTKTVTFDVTKDQGAYDTFMKKELNGEVLATTSEYVQRRPLLGRQKPQGQPDVWVHVVLISGACTTTLAIRADNLYVVAFKAQDGAWHCFSDASHQLPTARPLPFAGTYAGLTGRRGYAVMKTLPVGRTATQTAVSALAGYKAGGGAAISVDQLRQALATVVITFCEAQRFEVVLKNVTAIWDNGGYVSKTGVDLLVNWRETSCALLSYQKAKSWSKVPEAAKIKLLGDPEMISAAAAVQNIRFVLNTRNCEPINP